jgi:hypothetical protein
MSLLKVGGRAEQEAARRERIERRILECILKRSLEL